MVLVGCLALEPALTSPTPFGVLDVVAIGVTLAAIVLEAVADVQLVDFKARNTDPQAFLATGVWRWSRHPNYLGEIGFWVGLWMFGIIADPWAGWTIFGPVAMVALFAGYSIPAMDARMEAKRPGYAEYRKSVPALLPLPWTFGGRR